MGPKLDEGVARLFRGHSIFFSKHESMSDTLFNGVNHYVELSAVHAELAARWRSHVVQVRRHGAEAASATHCRSHLEEVRDIH